MIEIVFKKIAKSIRLAKWQAPGGKRWGAGIAIAGILLPVAMVSWPHLNWRCGHREQIANAMGSIGFFYGTPQVDSLGKRLVYFRTSKNGVAVFIRDTDGKTEKILHEWAGVSFTDDHDQVSPVSPDDKLFAYSYNDAEDEPNGYLAICDLNSGQEIGRVEATDYVFEIVWLASDKLVWLGGKGRHRGGPGFHLHVVQRQVDGAWSEFQPKFELANASSLVAVSDKVVGWADNEGLHELDTSSGAAVGYFDPGKHIAECSYCKKSGKFLVTCIDKGVSSLWELKLSTNTIGADHFNQLTADKRIQNARWINDGQGYVYFNQNAVVIRADATDKEPKYLPALMNGLTTTIDGRDIFLAGAMDDDPWAGVWRYNTGSGTLEDLVSYSEQPTVYAKGIDPLHCVVRVAPTNSIDYYVFRPAHFDRSRKYPLLITDTPIGLHVTLYSARGPSWAEAMAQCGAYVVIVDRQAWFHDIENWAPHTMRVYDELVPDPTIDASRVYLLCTSAEASYASKLVEDSPNCWRGVIFLNPVGLPDVAAIRGGGRIPRIFISGGEDEERADLYQRFQNAAAGRGMNVEIRVQPKSGHDFVSTTALRERIRAMAEFMFSE